MAQPKAARITCRVCDGWYDSDRELRDHMQAAHRRFISEPSGSQYGGTQSENLKSEPRAPNEESTNRESSPSPLQPGSSGRR
jgi:hypothetical protein